MFVIACPDVVLCARGPILPLEEFGAIESVKAASDLLTPVSGTVVEVNGAVLKDQSLVNKKAETDGWTRLPIRF